MGAWVNAESSGYRSDCKSELHGLMPANALYSRWYDVSHHTARSKGTKLVGSGSMAGGDHGAAESGPSPCTLVQVETLLARNRSSTGAP